MTAGGLVQLFAALRICTTMAESHVGHCKAWSHSRDPVDRPAPWWQRETASGWSGSCCAGSTCRRSPLASSLGSPVWVVAAAALPGINCGCSQLLQPLLERKQL